jgi:hypothetical protein
MHDDSIIKDVRPFVTYSGVLVLLPFRALSLLACAKTVFGVCYSVGRVKRDMAEICVKAVLAVADLPRRDVNLDLIKVCISSVPNSESWLLQEALAGFLSTMYGCAGGWQSWWTFRRCQTGERHSD